MFCSGGRFFSLLPIRVTVKADSLPARDDTSPVVPELLVCIGQLTENNIPKAPFPSLIQPLSNHTSQRSASSKAKSKSCASSLRLTWPNRTRWLCNIA